VNRPAQLHFRTIAYTPTPLFRRHALAAALLAWSAATAFRAVSAADAARDVPVTVEHPTAVVLHVGDTLHVLRPPGRQIWRVVYSARVLRSRDTAERRHRPGADGWRFDAVAAGVTEIVFTGHPGERRSAGPNVQRFILRVTVR